MGARPGTGYLAALALLRVAMNALIIELGVMAMLVVAGLIEGFVAPSNIDFTQSILVLVGTVTYWLLYLGQAGRSQRPSLTHSDRVEPT